MNALKKNQMENFGKLFPSISDELAEVVLLYAAGATQLEIVSLHPHLTKDKVNNMLHKAKRDLGLHSVQALRVVVHNRLYLALLGLLNF